MKNTLLYIIMVWLTFACTPSNKKNEVVTVFCASSLTDIVKEIAAVFEHDHEMEIQFNFASSGTLARQIEHGAQADVFISANKKWTDYLNEQGFANRKSKKIAENSLVAVTFSGSSIEALTYSRDFPEKFSGRIAIGDPRHVPAGAYAFQTFRNLGIEKVLQEQLLPAKDVRSALMVVELGEVEMGIVYKTDALKSKKVKIVSEISTSLHEPVAYYVTIIGSKSTGGKEQFFNFIVSEKIKPIWQKHGFIID